MAYDYGRFVWFELVADNKNKAKAFYAEVMGWTVKEIDMPA